MANTLKQLSDLITNDIKAGLKGIASDSFSAQQIQEEIKIARNYLIKKYATTFSKLNDFEQTICKVDLECVDLADCNGCENTGIESGQKALKFSIPKVSTSFNNKAISYLGTIDQSKRYTVYFDRSYLNHRYSAWMSKKPYAWIDLGSAKDGFINGYLFNGGGTKYLTVSGIFEDPFLANQCECNITGKYPEEQIFPVAEFMIQEIIDKVTAKFIQLYKANQPTILVPNTQSAVASI